MNRGVGNGRTCRFMGSWAVRNMKQQVARGSSPVFQGGDMVESES